MGLEEVVGEVRRGGEQKAQQVVAAARAEANAILDAARREAKQLEATRLESAAREAGQVTAQGASRAESESRKAVLVTQAQLRDELKAKVLKAFRDLPAGKREAHLKNLLATAQGVIPTGSVWGAAADAAALGKAKPYKHAGNLPIAGGIVVESEDGETRLDLTYETLLDGMWRDILKTEAALFQ